MISVLKAPPKVTIHLVRHNKHKEIFPQLFSVNSVQVDIRLKLFGEEHISTAVSYHTFVDTQHALGDFSLALQSKQRAFDIRPKLFRDEHSSTADS